MCLPLIAFLILDHDMQKYDFFNASGVISITGYSFMLLVGCCLLAMVLIYIMDLHLTLKKYVTTSERLLDGMHEGLLILAKDTNKTLLCNRKANSLLSGAQLAYEKTLPGYTESRPKHSNSSESSVDITQPKIFSPKQISVTED